MWGIILLLVINVCICAADVGSTIGGTASLNCDVNGASFTWQKQYSASSWYPLTDVYKYEGGRTSRLTILNFQQNDVGIYRCYGHDVNGNFVDYGSEITVVVVSPTVSIKYNYYYGEIGQSFTIPCVTGDSFAVQWKKVSSSGTQVINLASAKYTGGTFTTPSLTITNILSSDGGDYQCCGTNVYGQSCDQTTLIPGKITEAIILNEYYVTKEGEEITLECLIKNESSNIKLYWLKDAINVNLYLTNKYSHGTLNQPSLTIKNIETSDAGNYTCKLANLYGLSEDVVVLTVLFVQVAPPLHLSPNANESVFLPCEASGGNRVIWRRNGEEITTTGSLEYSGGTVIKPSLTISNVTRYHAGNYTCDTSYGSVTATSDTQLQLSVKDIPLVLISSNKIQASTGIGIQLGCYYESYPEPSLVFWNKDGGNLNVSVSKYNGSTIQKPSLTIINTNQLDAGIYVCAVVNEIGTGYSRKIQLIIKEKQKQQKYENKVPVIIGTSLSVTVFLLILFIVILLFIRSRRVKKRQESTYQTNEMIDAETHVYGQTETCHDYCNFDIKQTTATKNDIPFLEGDCLIERYNVLELTKRLNDAETLKARIRAEFKFLESNSVKVDIPTNDYEIVLKENQTGEPTKELKTLYIKQSTEDIFVFSSLPDDDNIEQFWSMIINYNIENIIMIVQKNEKTTSFYPTQDDVFKVAMLEIEMRSAEKTNDNIFMLRFILHDKNTRKKHHVKIFKTNWDDSDKYPSVESICTLLEKVKIEEGRPTLMTGSKGKCFSVCGSVSLCLQSVRAIERETTFSLLEYATLLKRIEDDFIKVFDDYVFCYKVMTQYLETVHTYSFIE